MKFKSIFFLPSLLAAIFTCCCCLLSAQTKTGTLSTGDYCDELIEKMKKEAELHAVEEAKKQ